MHEMENKGALSLYLIFKKKKKQIKIRTTALRNIQSNGAEGVTHKFGKDEAIYYGLALFLLAFCFNPQKTIK